MIDVPRETTERLDAFARLLIEENSRQNLIAASTVDQIGQRHIADSLQLLDHVNEDAQGCWLDIGSGPGLPGLVLAIAAPTIDFVLVEPRLRRTEFLDRMVSAFALQNVTVVRAKLEAVDPLAADFISARAVASLTDLFAIGLPHAAPGCTWILPKGRKAAAELADSRRTWQGRFSLVSSQTDPEAAIVIARDVTRKGGRR